MSELRDDPKWAMNTDREWLKRKATEEDGCFVSVGGLVHALEQNENEPASNLAQATRSAFIRLLDLFRRERGLTVEQFAEKADIDLAELVNIETKENYAPSPRTVYQVAQFLKLPERRLMALAGLVRIEDVQFRQAAVRFAARSASVEKLSREEHYALQEFVRFLSEKRNEEQVP